MIEHNHRHLVQAELAGCQEPPVAGDDPVRGIKQDRVSEAELHDGRRDLSHLRRGVRPDVATVGH